jgi:hypothetical protein
MKRAETPEEFAQELWNERFETENSYAPLVNPAVCVVHNPILDDMRFVETKAVAFTYLAAFKPQPHDVMGCWFNTCREARG